MAESNFVDYVKIYCRSGKGGRGSMHLRHVKYNPNGGPDGGDGGHGGSVYLRGNHNYWTLLHLKFQRHVFAEHGGNGGRDKCHGSNGKDQYIELATNVSFKTPNDEVINVDHADMGNKAIAFHGTSGVQLGWLASQSDMLSEDWTFVEEN